MECKNKCKKFGLTATLCAVASIMLFASPSLHANVTIPDDGNIYNISGQIEGDLVVYGTVNLLPDADIQWRVLAKDDCIVSITGGTVGMWVEVAQYANVTVYGTNFYIDGSPQSEGSVEINGVLTVNAGSETEFSMEFNCAPDATVILANPVSDPVQMLIDLGLYILEQVYPPEGIEPGIDAEMEGSLLAKVDAALAALNRSNPNDAKVAMNDLKALVNQVEAQTEKKISVDAATGIISRANEIIEELSTQ
jgi:hypothetical protein